MKIRRIVRSRWSAFKPICLVALVGGIGLGGLATSFGSVSIALVPPSTSPDCTGSVNVNGNVTCNPCDGTPPTVTINDSINPGNTAGNVVANPGCTNGTWIGNYTATVALKKGVNVLTATDSCKGSDSIRVTEDTKGVTYAYKEKDKDSWGRCFIRVQVTFNCLQPSTYYLLWEEITDDNPGCVGNGKHNNGDLIKTDGNGQFSSPDTAGMKCPGDYKKTCTSQFTCVAYVTLPGTTAPRIESGTSVHTYNLQKSPQHLSITYTAPGVTVGRGFDP